eukprot:1803182-Ditylum_brightwellii.AAC.1
MFDSEESSSENEDEKYTQRPEYSRVRKTGTISHEGAKTTQILIDGIHMGDYLSSNEVEAFSIRILHS